MKKILSFSDSSHESAREHNENILEKLIEKLEQKSSPVYNLIQQGLLSIEGENYIAIISPTYMDVWGRKKFITILKYLKKYYTGTVYIDDYVYKV